MQLVEHRLQFIRVITSLGPMCSVSCMWRVIVTVCFITVMVIIIIIIITTIIFILLLVVAIIVVAVVAVCVMRVICVAVIVVTSLVPTVTVTIVVSIAAVISAVIWVSVSVAIGGVMVSVVSVTAVVIILLRAVEGGSVVVQLLLQSVDLPLQQLLQRAGVGDGCVPLLLRGIRVRSRGEALITMSMSFHPCASYLQTEGSKDIGVAIGPDSN